MKMNYRSRKITLTFEISEVGPDIPDELLSKHIETAIHDWRDGRYGFCTEMIHDGLGKIVQWAIGQEIERAMRATYGNRMAHSLDGMTTASVAHIMTGRHARGVSASVTNAEETRAMVETTYEAIPTPPTKWVDFDPEG